MYEYDIKILRVVDGDTVDVMVDLGFDVWIKNRLRLFGIDAPESRTRDLEEKKEGLAATAILESLLTQATQNKTRITIKSHGVDLYGRSLATIFIHEPYLDEPLDVNAWLLAEGFAEPYTKTVSYLVVDNEDTDS